MAAGDWIKLHRRILEGPIFRHDGMFRLWCYCLLRANWKATTWMIPGTTKPIDVPRGSFITGRAALHHALYGNCRLSTETVPAATTVWNWLKSLERLECLSVKNIDNRCTLVTVCKYSTYQDLKQDSLSADAPPPVSRLSTGLLTDAPPTRTEEEIKNIRTEEGKKESLPALLQTDSFVAAWRDWEQHRKEIKHPLKPTMAVAQLKMLADMGHDRAVAAIRHTIAMGWQGLKEPEANGRATQAKPWTPPKI